jgi:predicted permease
MFDGAMAWATDRFDLARGGEARMIDGIWASGSFFDVLGVIPIVGRPLGGADDRRGGGPDGPVAVISYDFWQREFGGAMEAVGRTLTLNRVPFTIVGIAPSGFFGPDVGRTFDVIIPLGTEPLVRGQDTWLDGHWTWWLNIIVRLKPGQTIDAAQAALDAVRSQIREATMPPSIRPGDVDTYLTEWLTLSPAATGRSPLRARYQRPLVTLQVVVGLVLLVACANIANLLLARAMVRRHELNLRLALGAPRWRLAQQLLIESFVLASAGAAGGLLFARWTGRAIVAGLSTPSNLVFLDLTPDWRVFAFTTAVTVLTALVFGTVPALRASRTAPMASMKDGARTFSSAGKYGLANALVVGQVALSLMLVVVAGLFVRTFVSLATRPLGLRADHVLVVDIAAPQTQFRETDRAPLFEQVRAAVASMPGVAQSAMSRMPPITGGQVWNTRVNVEGAPPLTDRQRTTLVNAITPQWFATIGTPLIAGRDFSEGDRLGSPPVAIVNQAFARQFGLSGTPVGRVILRREPGATRDVPVHIVGVAADAVYRVLRDPFPATMYVPLAQEERANARIVLSIRSSAARPAALARSIETAIAGVNRDLVLTFRPLTDQINATLIQERLLATLSGFFGGLALLLAGLGLYGVTAYGVSCRRSEIGIRMALGAAPAGVIRLVLSHVFILILLGIVAGAVLSAWMSRFVATLLYGTEPRDPATLAASVLVLACVALFAGWLPARRAARLDPAEVLRES